jgi:hypothetical protein
MGLGAVLPRARQAKRKARFIGSVVVVIERTPVSKNLHKKSPFPYREDGIAKVRHQKIVSFDLLPSRLYCRRRTLTGLLPCGSRAPRMFGITAGGELGQALTPP